MGAKSIQGQDLTGRGGSPKDQVHTYFYFMFLQLQTQEAVLQ